MTRYKMSCGIKTILVEIGMAKILRPISKSIVSIGGCRTITLILNLDIDLNTCAIDILVKGRHSTGHLLWKQNKFTGQ